MPIAHVSLIEGRTEAQKAALIAAVTKAIHDSIGAPIETVRVLIDEVPAAHWGIGGETALVLRKTSTKS
jgi:4-oxalocrotonate tautomerase